MAQDIGFGIIGTGNIAAAHAVAIGAVPGARLIAVHNHRAASGLEFSARHGCDYEYSLEALLARQDIDAIAIAAPSGVHSEIGMAAARAGKHVLCEKPLDIDNEKVDALIGSCREQGVRLSVIYPSRFGPGARAARRAMDSGRLGRLVQCSAYIQWYRPTEYYSNSEWRGTWRLDGGGALMNQGIHSIDLLLWLAGDATRVSAFCQTRIHGGIEVEDNAVAWLQFAHGGCGVVQGSTCCYPGESRRIELKGDRGSITLLDDKPVVWEFDEPRPEDAEIMVLRNGTVELEQPRSAGCEGHYYQYEDFLRAVKTGTPLAVEGTEGRRAVRLVNAIYESHRRGVPVDIPAPGK